MPLVSLKYFTGGLRRIHCVNSSAARRLAARPRGKRMSLKSSCALSFTLPIGFERQSSAFFLAPSSPVYEKQRNHKNDWRQPLNLWILGVFCCWICCRALVLESRITLYFTLLYFTLLLKVLKRKHQSVMDLIQKTGRRGKPFSQWRPQRWPKP